MRAVVVAVVATALLAACSADPTSPPRHSVPLGTRVDVGYYPQSGQARGGDLGVTVTGVRKASAQDLVDGGLSLDEAQQEATPYYVDLSYENVGATSVTDPPGASGEQRDGTPYSALVVIDLGGPAYGPCPGTPESVAPGATATGCSIVLVPRGGSLDRVSYFAGGSDGFRYWDVA